MGLSRLLLLAGGVLAVAAISPAGAYGHSPVLVGRLGAGLPRAVAADGRHVYCAMHDAVSPSDPLPLAIIDTADLDDPRVVGVCDLPSSYQGTALALSGDILYVLADPVDLPPPTTSLLVSVDVSDPAGPTIVDQLALGRMTSGLELRGERLYTIGGAEGLAIIGTSASGDLGVIGGAPAPEGEEVTFGGWDVAGSYAYITYQRLEAGNPVTRLRVVDVSDAASPVQVADSALPDGAIRSLLVEGGQAYATRHVPGSGSGPLDPGDDELVVIDVSAPAAPAKLGTLLAPDSRALVMAHADNLVYMAVLPPPVVRVTATAVPATDAAGGTGIWIVDVSAPAAPTKVGECPSSIVAGFALEGTRAHVTDRGYGSEGLCIFDVASPTTPVKIGGYQTQGYAHDVAVLGDYVLLASDVAGVQVADVEDRALPRDAGLLEMQECVTAVAASGRHALVGDSGASARLRVLDFSTPSAPAEVGSWPAAPSGGVGPDGTIHALVVDGSRVYVSAYLDEPSTLFVLDLSEPATPTTMGSVLLSSYMGSPDIKVSAAAGEHAYVVNYWDRSLGVIDVGDPADPHLVGSCPVSGYPTGAAAQGGYVYVATVGNALSVVNASNPAAPVEVATLGAGACAADISVAGAYAFVSTANATYVDDETWLPALGGVRVIDISNPLAPTEAARYEQDGPVDALRVEGDYAYACEDGRGLLVLKLNVFTDVPTRHWAYAQIEACAQAGIVAGYGDGTYHPTSSVTRAQMAAYIARALAGGDATVPAGPAEASFSDVPDEHWAYRYIEYVKAQNVVVGYGDGRYEPARTVDRGQMAVFVARAIAPPSERPDLPSYVPPAVPTFSDVTPTNAWAWAYRFVEYIADPSRAVVVGYRVGAYAPEQPCTRDQMAVYIARGFELTP